MDAQTSVGQADEKFKAQVTHFEGELKKLRTGRASASMLDGVMVVAYGSPMPLIQVGNVTAPEAQLLQITPFDPSNIQAIASAIRDNPSLGLNPSDDGRVVRIPIPALTTERRQQIVKQLNEKVEDCMIAMRGTRHEALDKIEKAKKDKEIGEDEAKRLQKLLDESMAKIKATVDAMAKAKEQRDNEGLMSDHLPTHVGIILDGNRRWAKARGLKPMDGHKEGAENFKKVSLAAFDRGVKYLTAFVFSTENWHRAKDEVSFLMKLMIRAVELHLDEFHQKNIRIVVVGSRDNIPPSVLKAINRTETKTAGNTGGVLGLCFNYGGKPELIDAIQKIVASAVAPTEIDEKLIDSYLYEPEIPAMDLMIRTSGERRTSGFMMWRADYAELYFSDKLWPDFTVEDLGEAIADYASRQRRFGK